MNLKILYFFIFKNLATIFQILKTIVIARILDLNELGEAITALSIVGGIESGMASLFNDDIYSNINENNITSLVIKISQKEFIINSFFAIIIIPILYLYLNNKILSLLPILLVLNSGLGSIKAVVIWDSLQENYSKIELKFAFISLIIYTILIYYFGLSGLVFSAMLSYFLNQFLARKYLKNIIKSDQKLEFKMLNISLIKRIWIMARVIITAFMSTLDNVLIGFIYSPITLSQYSLLKSTYGFSTKIANPMVLHSHSKSLKISKKKNEIFKHFLKYFTVFVGITVPIILLINLFQDEIIHILYKKKIIDVVDPIYLISSLIISRFYFVFFKPFMAKELKKLKVLIVLIIPLTFLSIGMLNSIQYGLIIYTFSLSILWLIYLFKVDEYIYNWLRSLKINYR